MELNDLILRFSDTPERQCKAIFNTLFIVGNKLQTLFDSRIPQLSLKQFMLLSVVRQAEEPLSLTKLGALLGCSRQNIRKLADALAKKGFIAVEKSPHDPRAVQIRPTEKAEEYFQTEFSPYQAELQHLFAVYTEEEIATLFRLLARMYAGIENLEAQTQQATRPDEPSAQEGASS